MTLVKNLNSRPPSGSRISTSDGTVYHFKPDPETGEETADVKKSAHLQDFLRHDHLVLADENEGEDDDNDISPDPGPAVAPAVVAATTGGPAGSDAEDGLEVMTDGDLDAAFKDATGREPHSAMKRENKIMKIREARDAAV